MLTGRELEIVKLMADGKNTKEIAHLLGISVDKVLKHRADREQILEYSKSVNAAPVMDDDVQLTGRRNACAQGELVHGVEVRSRIREQIAKWLDRRRSPRARLLLRAFYWDGAQS